MCSIYIYIYIYNISCLRVNESKDRCHPSLKDPICELYQKPLKFTLYLNYIHNQQVYFNIYDAFYSQRSHQHVSAAIAAIFRVMLLLQECRTYKCC